MTGYVAYFRFFSELNDFLPVIQHDKAIPYALDGGETVKHAIEALGIPHPEVGLLLVNEQAVGFEYRIQDKDRIHVYPEFHPLATTDSGALRPPLVGPIRFVLDTHLGQLATYLRLFGFDTLYRNDYEDATLAGISSQEGRVLLTRDRGLLKRRIVTYGYCVRESEPRAQLLSILQRYQLRDEIVPWRRCLRCNGILQPVQKEEVLPLLKPKTKRYYSDFQQCQQCGQVFWQGSHHEQMEIFIANVIADMDAAQKSQRGGGDIRPDEETE